MVPPYRVGSTHPLTENTRSTDLQHLPWALPQAFASWEIPRPPAHAADNLLHRGGERWQRYSVPAGRWLVTVGPCCPPGPHWGAYHGRGSPWPRDHVLLDPASQPALAGRF